LSIKEKEKEIQKKRNIKSRKVDKRKKNISFYMHHNSLYINTLVLKVFVIYNNIDGIGQTL